MADNFGEPQSRNEAILQNILGAENEIGEPQSRNEAILQAILYDLDAIPAPYVAPPQSRIEELLVEIWENGGGGGSATLIEKYITENGDYDPADDNADGYSPVHVSVSAPVPVLVTKSITENGTYSAQNDNADGYSEVTVNVPPTLFRGLVDRSIAGSITAEDLAGVTKIGNYAFYDCNHLTSFEIPSGVTMIGVSAFRYAHGLQRITILATTPPTLSNTNAFDYTNDCPIYVPFSADHSILAAYQSATNWSALASRIQEIPTT